ncbi:MAG: aminotransferase class I/II-fold pyridoxal phosphate-dependent enzyme, partial [Planctomycetes bacterium]|nr:aminotransferase class I/II-fold pyridoxal phosphate-dependent enzyme [Planctomycetota bacterium]
HGFGVLGHNGRGSAELAGLDADEHVLVAGTASKALGGHGGLVAGPRARIERILDRCAWTAGSTPPPVPVAAATAVALRIARNEPGLRARLHANAAALRARLQALGIALDPEAASTPIVALHAPRGRDVEDLHAALRDDGILVPVLGAYGGLKEKMLRIAVFATHEPAHLDALADALRQRM